MVFSVPKTGILTRHPYLTPIVWLLYIALFKPNDALNRNRSFIRILAVRTGLYC